MTFGVSQHRAKEDQYFLYMAFCIIVMMISAFPLYAHIGGAVKYLLLRYAGEITMGEVTSIKQREVRTDDDVAWILLLKNSNAIGGLFHVTIKFSANNNPAQARRLVLTHVTEDMVQRKPIELIYFISRPSVFLPTRIMSTMKIDVYVAGFLGLVFLAGCLGLVTAYWRWQNFLAVASQYGNPEDRV